MQNFSRFLPLAALLVAPLLALAAEKPRKIGEVIHIVDGQTIPITIAANSVELQSLARLAFSTHGRYDVSGRRPAAYDIKLTAVGANQVRVDITKGSAAATLGSDTVSGTTLRHALLKAADVAVVKTNGLGLRGFFTARLAFISQRGGKGDVFTSDLFLGEPKQLTHDNALVITPRWSPDGSRIIYTSYFKSGAPDIFVSNAATRARETIVSLRGSNWGARFSPNGQQIAMVLSGEGSSEIYVTGPQGRIDPRSRRTRSDQTKSSPCWSPDGSQIAFVMDPGPQLYVMPAAGGQPRRLPLTSAGLGTYAAEPDWNRVDGNKIACTVRVGKQYQIAVFDIATSNGKVVSKARFDAVEPSWLADGRHLVCTVRDGRSSVLSILDTETGNSAQITQPDGFALQASVWTP